MKQFFFTLLALGFICWPLSTAKAVQIKPSDVVKMALSQNRDIKILRLQARAAGLALDQILASYDPQLKIDIDHTIDQAQQAVPIFGTSNKITNFNFNLLKKFSTGTELSFFFNNQRQSSNSTFAIINPAWESSFGLELRQPLLKNTFGKQERLSLKANEHNVRAREEEILRQIELTAYNVLRDYWFLMLAEANLKIAKESENTALRLLKTNRKNARFGLVEKVDLLSFEANLENSRRDLITAADDLQRAEAALRVDLNIAADKKPELPLITLREVAINLEESTREALSKRKDLKSLKESAQEQGLLLSYWENDNLPSLDLLASLRANGINDDYFGALNEIGPIDNPTVFFGISFSNIFNNRQSKNELKRSQLAKEELLLRIKQSEFSIVQQIKTIYQTVAANLEKVNKLKKIYQLQFDKFKEEEKRFKQGRGSTNFLIQYNNEAVLAALQQTTAIAQYELSLLDLALARGDLLASYAKK